ncbi:MAG: PIN domain-containing protein [Candidatus Thermoplasmatota archaeon]|nr:PIN domain-containing protein [Candidatus Thermoplasmatota archaeon]
MDSKFLDVNAIAVFLDESHIGHPFLREAVMPGFRGDFRLLLSSYLLIRARWVLVSRWAVAPQEADTAVGALAGIRSPTYVSGDGRVVVKALELAGETGHDMYDCFIVALAASGGATHLITTDMALRYVCEALDVEYENPVPREVLQQFGISGRPSS